MKQIEINGKTYKLKYTIRSLFIFEQITKKSFKIESLLDNYVFFYSMILANNPDSPIEWDDFLDAMDANPKLLEKMTEILNENDKENSIFDGGEVKEDDKKKS